MTEKSMIMNRKRNRKQCMVKRYSCLFTAILITFLILAVSLSICFTVNADQEKPKRLAYKYYTDIVIQKGESLWDIAKRFHTDEEAIRVANQLENEEDAAQYMLLIPKIR